MPVSPFSVSSIALRILPLLVASGTPLVLHRHAQPERRGTLAAPALAPPHRSAADTRVAAQASEPTVSINVRVGSEGDIRRDQCITFAIAPHMDYQCGALRVTHALPTVTTMGTSRTPILAYSSVTQNMTAKIPVDFAVPASLHVVQMRTSVRFRRTPSGPETPVISAMATPWPDSLRDGRPKRVLLTGDASRWETGAYHYRVSAQAILETGESITLGDTGTIAIVNRSASPFGPGWWLDGLEQVLPMEGEPSMMFWVGGDGSTRLYRRSPTDSTVLTPVVPLDGPDTLLQLPGAMRWQRRLRNGAYTAFDALGRHIETVSRTGDTTRFGYDPANPLRLQSIAVPVPNGVRPAYTLSYGMFDGTGPIRLLQVDAASVNGLARRWRAEPLTGDRMAFVDPDGSSVTFSSRSAPFIRTDQLGNVTVASGRYGILVDLTTIAGGSAITTYRTFCPAELASFQACQRGPTDLATLTTTIGGVRGGNQKIDWTRFTVTRYGAPASVTNALSQTTTIERNDPRFPLLVTGVVHPSGFTQRATYNARGLDSTRTDIDPLGPGSGIATTRYVWSGTRFDVLDSIIGPTGTSTAFGYDTRGNRTWQQDGRGAVSRVQFVYNANNQVVTIAKPGNNPASEVDSVVHDPVLGNVARTRSPLLATTRYHTDAIGRVDTVYSAVDQTHTRVIVDSFDLMDRVVLHREIGPAIPFSIGTSFVGGGLTQTASATTMEVRHYYDPSGNEIRLERWSTPNPTNVPLSITSWTYDSFHRKTSETTSNGRSQSWLYDAAGNDTLAITPRGNRIRTTYDALNRPILRITDAAPYVGPTIGQTSVPGHAPSAPAAFPAFVGGFAYDFKNPSSLPPALALAADTATFTYDLMGGISTAVNATASVSRDYFPNGQLKSDVNTMDGQSYSMRYTPALDGRLISRTDDLPGCPAGGCVQLFAYEPGSGRLADTWEVDQGVRVHFDDEIASRYTGRRTFSASGALRTAVYDYFDADGRLYNRVTTDASSTIASDILSYDQSGRIAVASSFYPGDPRRDMRTENAYSGLGALAATIRNRQGITVGDVYQTDAFGNAAEHRSRNFTNSASSVVDRFTYNGDRQEASAKSTVDFQPPQNPPSDVLDQTSTVFDVAGNRVHTQRLVSAFDQSIAAFPWLPLDAAWVQRLTGTEWTWNAYDANDHLRVAQRSFWVDEFNQRTAFIEYDYDALGRKVRTHTRWDSHCSPSLSSEECLPSIEHTIWDGDQVRMELRASAIDSTVISTGEPEHECMPDSDWNSNPWCNPDGTTRYSQRQVTYRDASAGVYTPGNFSGIVRYTQAAGIDDPLVVYRAEFPDGLVPHRSWRGLFEDGTLISASGMGINWPARDLDAFGARDVRMSAYPIPASQWLGSLVGDRKDPGGLVYMRNRFYDPATGRFTQEDPIGLAGGMNLYGFASGDPVNFTDPFGLCPPKDDNTADCAPGTSGWYANRLATGVGNAALNTIGGVLSSCNESSACGLVLDVASLGAGALERRAAVAATEKIVIGETMTRVRSAATSAGAGTFETTARTARQMYTENMSWLRKGMRDGKQIIDIGMDANRAVRSPWYRLEKELIERRGYPVTKVSHPWR